MKSVLKIFSFCIGWLSIIGGVMSLWKPGPLMAGCGSGCWLEGFALMFGERGGRIFLASASIWIGAIFLLICWRLVRSDRASQKISAKPMSSALTKGDEKEQLNLFDK